MSTILNFEAWMINEFRFSVTWLGGDDGEGQDAIEVGEGLD